MIALITSETTISRLNESAGVVPFANALTKNSELEMSAAAPPPAPLNSATICGMAVIFTFSAENSPIAPPTTMPSAITHHPAASISQIEAAIASSMPPAA